MSLISQGTQRQPAMTTREHTYRSEVVGSLLRPDYLKDAMRRFEAGELPSSELEQLRDRAVLEAIALQETCDIDVITDGEMRRFGWFDSLTGSLSGYSHQAPAPAIFAGALSGSSTRLPAVAGRLAYKANLPLREMEFLRGHTTRPTKATLPSMSYASVMWVPGISDKVYPDKREYLDEALKLTRTLVAELAASGVSYIQLDAPRYTHLVSDTGRANLSRLGIDTRTWLDETIALDNALMADSPQVTFCLHLCRGNYRSMWSVEGGYEPVAEKLFNEMRCERLHLEYDSPRAGSFEPLRLVPRDKRVILGLITTKEPQLESEDLLQRRVQEATRYIPLERLALSPQCGFASSHEGNLLTPDDQRAKLALLGRVAKQIWRGAQ